MGLVPTWGFIVYFLMNYRDSSNPFIEAYRLVCSSPNNWLWSCGLFTIVCIWTSFISNKGVQVYKYLLPGFLVQ